MNRIKPNIYDFKAPLNYLRVCYDFDLSQDPTLSVRKWANRLHLSADYLLGVFKEKKKISVSVLPVIADYLALDQSEKKYFEIMVRRDHAGSEMERQNLELVLGELGQLRGTRSYVEDQSVFSHWVHMAIISMSKLNGLHCSRETIRDFLCEQVSQEQIEEAIRRLQDNGLITLDQSGRIHKNYDHTTTKNDAFRKSPHRYFEQVSELAKRGSQVDALEREFQCFSLAIQHSDMETFKEMIRNFRAKVAAFADGRPSDQVYQLNLQFFPLTRQLETGRSQVNHQGSIQ